jgi:serine/threonine-protein kinase
MPEIDWQGHVAPPLTAKRPEDMVGQILGTYEILSIIGMGGMGAVFKARHLLLGHEFALKVLLPDRYLSDSTVRRFQEEAKAMIKLNSPYVVLLREFGISENGLPYMVADLCEGETLSAILQSQGHLAPEKVAGIGVDICLGLEEASHCAS